MSRYKTWMIAGYTVAGAALLLFAALATHILAANPEPSPVFTLVALLDVLLGTTGGCLLIGATMVRWMVEQSEELANRRWWKGYSAAVEDLETRDNVRELPVPAHRSGRHG